MHYKESPLTAPLRAILAKRETGDTPFSPNGHLNAVLQGVGIAPDSTGGAITFTGADPIVPSVFRLGAAAGRYRSTP